MWEHIFMLKSESEVLHTLYTADCHKLSSIQVRSTAILALLHRLRDQFSTMFLHMGRHLLCHVSYHRTQSINCKYNYTVEAYIRSLLLLTME